MKRITGPGVASAMLGIALWLSAGTASAQQCAGFSDVQETDDFCHSVQWLKNRGITLGCNDGSAYCPNDAVSRAAMALFLNRMGIATAPRFVSLQAGTVDAMTELAQDQSITVCQTDAASLPPVPYPQRLRARGTVSGLFNTFLGLPYTVGMTLLRSFNAEAFSPMVSRELRVTSTISDHRVLQWTSDVIDVPPGTAISVAIRISNRGPSQLFVHAGDAGCAIEVEAVGANPTSAPF